jgi:ABC-2 type transport system permease protein
MKKLYYIMGKEFLQVIRDLPGLGLLFLMPALLLIVITLTQEKVMTGMDSDMNIVMVNSDRSALGDTIQQVLGRQHNINLVVMDSETEAEQAVFRGKYQVLVVVPDSATEQFPGSIPVKLLYDPAIMKLYKDIMGFSLQAIIESAAVDLYFGEFTASLVSIEEGIAGGSEFLLEYNIVSNNVPAFILFAMFFIVIPLAGSILNEKQQGTRDRLMTLPVTWFTLFSGKIIVYLGICILQFCAMAAIGRFLIPVLCDLPPLPLDIDMPALVAIAVASGLASIGFGLAVGTLSASFQQAAPVGAVLVVILAILGGIFVPSYMMPDLISRISFISPLRWGADALYSIFARDAGMDGVLLQFFLLLTFFIGTFTLSFRAIRKRH